MESVSSFIGIDGTNSTLNSGRIQINLKDREQRQVFGAGGDSAAGAPGGAGGWDSVLSAAAAGPDGGRPGEPDAVSVLAGGRECG